MKFRIFLIALFLLTGTLSVQSQQSDSTRVMSESDIILHVEGIAQELFKITAELNRTIQIDNIREDFEDYKPEHERYFRLGNDQLAGAGINRIQDLIIITERIEVRLDAWQEEVLAVSNQLSEDRRQLEYALLSLDSLKGSDELTNDRYIQHVDEVEGQLLETRGLLDTRKEEVLNLQIEIADQYVEALKKMSALKNLRANYWNYLINRDSTIHMDSEDVLTASGRVNDIAWRVLDFFRVNVYDTLFFIIVISLITYMLYRIKLKDPDKKFRELYNQRLAIALVLGLLLFPVIFPPTTTLMYNFMLVISYIPFLFILRQAPFREQFGWYLGFFLTYLLIRLSSFYMPFVPQMIVVIIYLGGALVFLAFLFNKKQYRAFNPKWKFARVLLWLLKLLIVAALICYFTNRVVLAKLIIEGVGDTIALGMVILYIGHWFDILIDWLKDQPALRHLHSSDTEMGWEKVKNFIRFGLVLIYLTAFTHYFYISDAISDRIMEFLTSDRSIGSLTFDYLGILLFLLVIYLSSKVASWIKFFSEGKSYYGSVKKTSTVATSLRFGVIMLGFLLALFLSGIPIDKITIILGALSVGLGFGLQNIVNNLVSGIILIFERPVQAGDFVEVKTYSGIVKEIGIRASVVRTFDGAEVIIPNGHLISEEVINWTLTNQHRRVEVIAGVSYGSDVRKVKEILSGIIEDFPGVLKLPKPVVLFKELGESSLNFSTRFWVSNIDDWLIIKSDMTTAIYEAFNEAGIEIPFPQRDLHIKSMSVDDLKNLGKSGQTE